MATHKSAMKRNKQNIKKNTRNRTAKSEMKTVIREVREAAASGKTEDLQKKFKAAQKLIASTASKGVIAATTGARYISRLASLVGKSVSKTK